MNFLNPAYLFALAAVAVPILIHIFTRRRVPEVPFGTIRFLKPADRRSMVRIDLRRLLLLALRILGVALLALAFARPVVRGALAVLFPAGGSRAACILVDRSFSMRAESEGGTAFDRARSRAASVLERLDAGDRVTVVLFDTAAEVAYDGELNVEAVLGAIEAAAPSWGATDLRSAVEFGRRALEASRREVRELYLVSDFQKTGLGPRPPADAPPRSPVRALLLPIQPGDAANAAIEEVRTPRAALHRGETANAAIVMRNTSKELAARFPVEVLLAGRRVMEKETDIPPASYRTETVPLPAERPGWIEGIARKRTDRLGADDTRYFTLHVEEKVKVLLVADEGAFYLEQALSPAGADGDIDLEKKGSRLFTSADLARAAVVVLGPGRGIEPRDAELVERFVAAGGTAFVLVLPELAGVVGRLSRAALSLEFAEMPQGFFTIAKPQQAPYFLGPFGDEDFEALGRLRLRRAAFVRGVPGREVHLSLSTGHPFVWEERIGEGSVIFACIDPRPEAGELVLSPHFLPLVQQIVLAGGRRKPLEEGVLVGEPMAWTGGGRGEIAFELPGGRLWKPARIAADAGPTSPGIAVPPAGEPGFVTITAGGAVVGKIAVNVDCRRESDLAYLSAAAAADSLGLEHRMVVGEERDLAAAVEAAREGREITIPLLVAAIAVFAAELVVAQRTLSEKA